MRRFLPLSALLALALFTGCASHYRDTAQYSINGKAKPLVVVLPIIDSTEQKQINWDLSRELTEEITQRMSDSSRLFLVSKQVSLSTAQALNAPQLTKLATTLTADFSPAQFVVVSELITHKDAPYGLKKANEKRPHLSSVGSMINMAIRLRVLDLRTREPHIVLQEVVYLDHDVAKAYQAYDYAKNPWGTEAYERSPLGIAHSKIVRELVARVEGYVGAS